MTSSVPELSPLLLVTCLLTFTATPVLAQQVCDPSKEFPCASNISHCIAIDQVCNYYDSCGDNSDEQNCSYSTPDIRTTLVFSVNDQSQSTSILNLIFGNPDDYVWKFSNLSVHSSDLPINIRTKVEKFHTFCTLYVNPKSGRVYFNDNDLGDISYGDFITAHSTTPTYVLSPLPISRQIKGICLDWMSHNVYWTDGEYKLIGVVNVIYWKPIIDTNLTSPQGIAVHPALNYLFWSDGTGAAAKIERSDLSGKNRVVLVTSSQCQLMSPTKLTVDFTTQKLYWLDSAASAIGCVNFDGSDPVTWRRTGFTSFTSMAIHQNYLFFGKEFKGAVSIYNKTDVNKLAGISFHPSGSVTDIAIYSTHNSPPFTGPCSTNNGNCTQFCFRSSTTSRVCDCSTGFFLDTDNITCTTKPFPLTTSFLLVADFYQQIIYQLQPSTGEIRALNTESMFTVALTFDPVQSIMYLVTVQDYTRSQYRIRRRSLDASIDSIIYYANEDSILSDVTVDVDHSLLYFSDSGLGVVSEMSTDGTMKRDLIRDGTQQPTNFHIDTHSRLLYYASCSTASSSSTIQTFHVVTGHTQTVVTESSSCITAFTVDINNAVLYWTTVSPGAIKKSSLDGTQQLTLYSELDANFTGITILDNCLYITDSNRRSVMKHNITTNKPLGVQSPSMFRQLEDITAYQKHTTTTSSLAVLLSIILTPPLVVICLIIIIVCLCLRHKRVETRKSESSRNELSIVKLDDKLFPVAAAAANNNAFIGVHYTDGPELSADENYDTIDGCFPANIAGPYESLRAQNTYKH